MKLSKFLRKNSRTLILVFMSGLLVAFLVPEALQGLGAGSRGADAVLGTAFGREVTLADRERASADLQLVERVVGAPISRDDPLQLYLLMEEARRLGMRVGNDEVRQRLIDMGINDQRLQFVQRSSNRSYDEIYEAVGRWLAMIRLMQVQAAALAPSLPRAEIEYRDRNEQAVAKVSLVDAQAFLPRVPEPTEEQLLAFFEEAKARYTEHTEQELKFGYRLPDRVRLEYLTVDPREVQNRITVRSVAVRDFFKENSSLYTKPDPLTTQPVDGQIPQVPMTFEEAEERVREDYRRAKAIETAQSLVNNLAAEARRPWSLMPANEAGFREAPEEIREFSALRDDFSSEFPVQYGQTELLSQDELRQQTELGLARYVEGSESMGAPELAMQVQGILVKKALDDGKPALSVREPSPVVLTSQSDPVTRQRTPYQAFVFRVVEVAPSAPPESLDAVREQVVKDWKLSQAYALAKTAAEELAAKAREIGLDKAIEEASDLKAQFEAAKVAATQPATGDPTAATPRYLEDLEPYTVPRLTRQMAFIRGVGRVEGIAEAVFALGASGEGPQADHPVVTVPVANRFKWIVAELEEVKPMYAVPFEDYLRQAVLMGPQQELRMFQQAWHNPEMVVDRTGFVPSEALRAVAP